MQSDAINRLRSAIEYVEADKAQDYDNAETTGERVDLNDYNVSLSLEDAKALEAALPALAKKELCPCGDSLRIDRCQCGSFSKDEALIPSAEQERLRFEGDLDKWMKIIGAGITGYQPEAYAVMDAACEELVKLRATLSTEKQPSPAVATSQALINLATAVLGHAPATANEFMSISLDDIRSALSAQVQDVATPPIRLPTALSLMIEKGVDPEQNGYCRVIDVEKLLCAKLGREWSATGMSIVSLVDEISSLSAQAQDVVGWQPIETAPKDGSEILALWKRSQIQSNGYGVVWFEDGSWREFDYECLVSDPTHWMPLPSVPAAPAKQEG